MVDTFLENGFNYFDTAHGYVSGMSETALKECLTSRYSRDRYIPTDKLSTHFFEREEQIRPLFEEQLAACGVDYFDFYLMHAQSADIFAKFKRCRAYEVALELKGEGKVHHFGISFHDSAFRHEHHGTDGRQYQLYEGFPAVVPERTGGSASGLPGFSVQEYDSLHSLSLLHGWLPEKDIHP